MIKNTDKRGYYTLEAVIFLPIMVLCVLSLGYFTKVEGIWENCVHCAVDECQRSQAMAWDGLSGYATRDRIYDRIRSDDRGPSSVNIRRFHVDYSDGFDDHLNSFTLSAGVHMALPAGFSRDFAFSSPVLFRGFTGKNITGEPLGVSGLEDGVPGDPAYIFPAFGEKYHGALCTYVKASVRGERLDSGISRKYHPCKICHSDKLTHGSIVFCFNDSGTAYHKGSCRTLNRHVIVIDKTEAEEKGYAPCSKCGGKD